MSGIQMALLGAGPNVVYRLDDAFYSDAGVVGIQSASVSLFVGSGGQVTASSGSSIVDFYDWLTPTTGASTYFVRATLSSGALTPGSSNTGAWLPLTEDRFWFISLPDNAPAFEFANLVVAIATDSGGTNIVVSASISLQAVVS